MALIIPLHWMKAFRDSPLPTKLKRNPWSGAQVSVFYGLILWLLPPTTTYSAWQAIVQAVTGVGHDLMTESPPLPIQRLPRWHRIYLSAGDAEDMGLIPGSGGSPGRGNGNLLYYSCLEDSMDRGAWWAIVHGVAESLTQLTLSMQALFTQPPNYKDLDCFPHTSHKLSSQWLSQAHVSS